MKTISIVLVNLLLATAVWAQPAEPPRPAPPPPSEKARRSVQVFRGSVSYLGVGVAEITAERAKALNLKEEYGVEVTSVEKDSPADKAGIKAGDVVLEYNGHRVEGTEQFIRLVHETPVGRQAKLVVSRNGATQTLTATIGSRKGLEVFGPESMRWAMPSMPRIEIPDIPHPNMSWRSSMLGVEVEGLSSQLATYFGVKEGVLVRSVIKDSAAEKAGLKAGDVILKVGDRKVTTPSEVTAAIRSSAGKTVPLAIMRNHQEMSLTATLEQSPSGARPPRPPRTVRGKALEL
jgi:serine protease Do